MPSETNIINLIPFPVSSVKNTLLKTGAFKNPIFENVLWRSMINFWAVNKKAFIMHNILLKIKIKRSGSFWQIFRHHILKFSYLNYTNNCYFTKLHKCKFTFIYKKNFKSVNFSATVRQQQWQSWRRVHDRNFRISWIGYAY